MLGRRDRVGGWRVDDQDACPGIDIDIDIDIDIVRSNTGATDHAKVRGGRDQRSINLRRRAHDEGRSIDDPLPQCPRFETDGHVDVVVLCEQADPGIGDRLRDEDLVTHGRTMMAWVSVAPSKPVRRLTLRSRRRRFR